MTDKIVVLSTCGSAEEAERIARGLVEARLAACVNVLAGARSYYRWHGALESSDEWLLIIKSSRSRFEDLRAAIERLHSYEVHRDARRARCGQAHVDADRGLRRPVGISREVARPATATASSAGVIRLEV